MCAQDQAYKLYRLACKIASFFCTKFLLERQTWAELVYLQLQVKVCLFKLRSSQCFQANSIFHNACNKISNANVEYMILTL